jgi:hypothetical protein
MIRSPYYWALPAVIGAGNFIIMNILEKELEDLLFYALTELPGDDLTERGLYRFDFYKYVRQLDLKEYGIADIVGYFIDEEQKKCFFEIYELKKENINASTFFQAIRYAKALQLIYKGYQCLISIKLIGKTIDSQSDFCYLPDIFSSVSLYTYSIDFHKGIFFKEEQDYVLTKTPCFDKLIADKSKLGFIKEVTDAK